MPTRWRKRIGPRLVLYTNDDERGGVAYSAMVRVRGDIAVCVTVFPWRGFMLALMDDGETVKQASAFAPWAFKEE